MFLHPKLTNPQNPQNPKYHQYPFKICKTYIRYLMLPLMRFYYLSNLLKLTKISIEKLKAIYIFF